MGVCAMLAWRRRRAAYLLPWIIMPVVLFGPLWSEGGYHRRSLGILPFVVMAAAVLLGYVWTSLTWSRPAYRTLITGALVLLLAGYAGANLSRYVDDPRDTDIMRFVYSPELTHAANFMREEGAGTRIYYAADRWSVNYETLRYLDPEHSIDEGNAEDRSREFVKEDVAPGFENLDRSGPATIVLMSAYRANADMLAARYPEAQMLNGPTVDGKPSFIALRLPPR
jgi:hypothetical protein